MFIVHVASECAPAAKVGGLADMVQGLAWELAIRGHEVELILPKYDCMRYDHIWGLCKSYADLRVAYHDRMIHCDVYFGEVHGLKCFFIDPHSEENFFNRGRYYGANDDDARFAFFAKAALEFMLKADKHPDIIHAHDWQAGLVPVLLYETYAGFGMTHPRACYTLHNVHHQGITGEHILRQVGLDPARCLTPDRLLDDLRPGAVNLMKGGIVYANFVTTVSPRYMEEIRFTDLGHGLQGVLNAHAAKTGGVLNGVDYKFWNPEIDPLIRCPYGVDRLDDKYVNKTALRERLLLREGFQPILAFIGRLDGQKGVHLVRHALHYGLANGCQFVLLGSSPDPRLNDEFWALKHALNDNPDCHLEIGHEEELAHLVYAGADMVIVPSYFEPCGLTQLIAMKYGTVPVVRSTGGLANTVFDADYADKPYEERNGYCFHDFDEPAVESALHRAIGLWFSYPQHWRELMQNGMRYDYSWKNPGQDYLNIYSYIRE